jgi:cyclophilin family peptidyl-prolyl cis-trans isomerase
MPTPLTALSPASLVRAARALLAGGPSHHSTAQAADVPLFESLEQRSLLAIVIANPIPDQNSLSRSIPTTISLADRYTDNTVTAVVRMVSSLGTINAALFGGQGAGQAPNTVANFLTYANANRYDNTIIHRSVNNFVIQGGGFALPTQAGNEPTQITTDPAINLENPQGNIRGTIAMARTGQPNTATSQWFINTVDNRSSLDVRAAGTNGPQDPGTDGFAVFGRVFPASLSVVDALAAVPTFDFGSPFDDLPLRNWNQVSPVAPSNYVNFSEIERVQGVFSQLTATSSNANFVTASITGNQLTLTPQANWPTNTPVTITIRATDVLGNSVEDAFVVQFRSDAQISALQARSNVAVGAALRLTAVGVRDQDSAIQTVAFYRDSDANGIWTVDDQLLGTLNAVNGQAPAGGWRFLVDTAGLTAGDNRFFARLTTSGDGQGNLQFGLASRLVNLAPAPAATAASVASPSVPATGSTTLTITGVTPKAGARVAIYLDSNTNGLFNPLADRQIGWATFSGTSGEWTFNLRGSQLSVGTNTLFVRVLDASGNASAPISITDVLRV